jgi:hypothetical protein
MLIRRKCLILYKNKKAQARLAGYSHPPGVHLDGYSHPLMCVSV